MVITGGTGGIGYYSAIGIAATGVPVIVTGRSTDRGEAAARQIRDASGNPNVTFVRGDFSSLDGVDALASSLLDACGGEIGVLVNNVGYTGNEEVTSVDGIEMCFFVNVVAVHRLTMALLPALLASGPGARVLNVSGGDDPAAVDVENLQCEKSGFQGLMTYKHSKSVLEALSVAMAGELEPQGVSVNVLFPGRASTEMTRALSCAGLPGPIKCCYPCFVCMFLDDGGKGAEKAARTTIWLATSDELEGGVTGRYYDTNQKERKMDPTAYDANVHARILEAIREATQAHDGAVKVVEIDR